MVTDRQCVVLRLSKIKADRMLNVRAWLAAWFAKKAPDVSLADSHNFFEAEAIDSFGVIELVEDAEREFGIRFTAPLFINYRTK